MALFHIRPATELSSPAGRQKGCEMERNESLLKGNITGALVRFAVPIMLANILQLLYSATDMFVVGKFASTADVSGVTTGSIVMVTLTYVIVAFTNSVTVMLGRFAGAKKVEDMSKTVGTAILFFIALAAVLTALMLVLSRSVVKWMDAPPEAVDATLDYLVICSSGIIFITGYNLAGSILRGIGDSKTPLIFVAVACVINIAVDLILVCIFHMGAAGAAFATVGSQAGSLIFSIIYLHRKGLGFPFRASHIRWHAEHGKQLVKLGAPLALQEFLVNLSFMIITMLINGMGVAASAASGIVEKLGSFACRPTAAFSAAVSAMAANNIGAGFHDRAKKCMWTGICICVAWTVVFYTFSYFHGDLLVKIFSNDPSVAENGILYMRSYFTDLIVISFVFIMNGYFTAYGHTVFSMAHSLIATFLIRVPFSFIFSRMSGVTLFHMGIPAPISSLLSLILCLFFLRYQRRRLAAGLEDSLPGSPDEQ